MSVSPAPRHIFREYDIRGLAEKELTDETCRLIGEAFGMFLKEEGLKEAVPEEEGPEGKRRRGGRLNVSRIRVGVGRDLRPSSERIQSALFESLLASGVDVVSLGLIPTPVLYFAIVHLKLDAGISLTGSHNPPEYNGFKFQLADRPFYGDDIRRLAEGIEKERGGLGREEEGRRGEGACEKIDILPPYLARLKKEFHYSKKWKIAVDSGHGMAGLVAPRLFKELGQETIELYSNLDPTFPDHHPDPSVLENLRDLSRKVRETKAHLGIAFDGDMDRIGVVDERGEPILGDRLLLIFARQVLKERKGAAIIGDVKCSPLLYEDIRKRGGQPILWKTGHSLIKAKMKEEKAALGGEMSGHMFFADRWYGFDDALYAACRLVEILDQEKKPLSQLLSDLPKVVSTPEIRVEVKDDEKKFEIVRQVVAELKEESTGGPSGRPYPYRVIDLDGARIEFDDGFGLIRASNTQPVLVMRFEAASEKRLKEIRELIEGKVKKYL